MGFTRGRIVDYHYVITSARYVEDFIALLDIRDLDAWITKNKVQAGE
jgi:hypothetical protein